MNFGTAFGLNIANDWITSAWKQDKAEGMMEDSQNFAADQAASAQQFSERMYDTRYQKTVADLKAAGLNPMLGYSQGPGHQPSGAIGNAPGASTPGFNNSNSAGAAAMVENLAAQTDKTRAEADEVRARTPTHAVSIDQMRANIENLLQQAKTGAATAANVEQQTKNLQELIPQIRAQTEQLRTLSNLNKAQITERLNLAGVHLENAHEIQQRVKQNLPEMERAIMQLEKIAMEMAQPGHMANEAAQASFVGTLGAYLRALIPLQGVMGAIPLGRLRTTPAPDRRPHGTPAERNYYGTR